MNSDKLIKKHFNGMYHQNMPRGVPLIEYKGDIYAYMTTTRRWGDIVAKVLAKTDKKKYKSLDAIEKELGKNNKKPLTGKNTYCYLDFAWTWNREFFINEL